MSEPDRGNTCTAPSLHGDNWEVRDLVEAAEITRPDQIRDRLFFLARGVKALELREGRRWGMSERQDKVFQPWWAANQARCTGVSRMDLFAQFDEAYDCAKEPLGDGNLPLRAWAVAETCTTFPKVAEQFEDIQWKQLVLWCREIQRLAGDRAWFLSSPMVARQFHLPNHHLAYTRLKHLVKLGILEPVAKGHQRKANRYRYLPPLDE